MAYLTIAKIIKTHGVDGELSLFSTSTQLKKRLEPGKKVFIYKDDQYQSYEVISSSVHHKIYVKLSNVNTIEKAKELVGYDLECIKDELEEGHYYFEDLKHLKVFTNTSHLIGEVIDVYDQSYQINLKIKNIHGKIFYLPFVDSLIEEVNIQKGFIRVKFLGGML